MIVCVHDAPCTGLFCFFLFCFSTKVIDGVEELRYAQTLDECREVYGLWSKQLCTGLTKVPFLNCKVGSQKLRQVACMLCWTNDLFPLVSVLVLTSLMVA